MTRSPLVPCEETSRAMPSRLWRTDDSPCWTDDPDVRHRAGSLFAVISILVTTAFLYASTVPLEFAVPDYRGRFTEIFASFGTETGRTFDWTINLLALLPLGFFWSGELASRACTRSSAERTFGRVAGGCLCLAVLAETLQVWLPLRVPALRDLVALECGACLGCGLWWLVGAQTTQLGCRIWQRCTARRTTRMPGLAWLGLFAVLMGGCLAINSWASPSQCFQMYRQRTFSSSRAGTERAPDLGNALITSTGTAFVLICLCGLGVRAGEQARMRPARGFHIFVHDSSSAPGVFEPGVLGVDHTAAGESMMNAAAKRAA